jgi:hypothetical protein
MRRLSGVGQSPRRLGAFVIGEESAHLGCPISDSIVSSGRPRLTVSIQVPGFDAAVSDGWLRFGDRRDAAVVAERGFRDDSGL